MALRLLIHDYAGHPFQIQLSQALAARGHRVRHVYCDSLMGPQGRLTVPDEVSNRMDIRPIQLPRLLDKNAIIRRWLMERHYGRLLVRECERFTPDAVISANTPLDAQAKLLRRSRHEGWRFVFWLQDLLGVGIHQVLRGRILGLGNAIGRYYVGLEARLLRRSDEIVVITDDFRSILARIGVSSERIHTIENWAPLEEIPVQVKANRWANEHGLQDKFVFLYSGTLGMKHNPSLLLGLARCFRGENGVSVVVVSAGRGAAWLAERAAIENLANLVVIDFQPFSRLQEVLGAADVLVGILEPDAGVFSVPSKVLTYHCAARPVLLAVPEQNLVSRIVERNGTGLVTPPDDVEAFLRAARRLAGDPVLRRNCGQRARRYAEETFSIHKITDLFEAILA